MLTFLARDSICYIALCHRPSVYLYVTRVDQSKTVEVRIMQIAPQSSPMTLVSSRITSRRNCKGNIRSAGAEWQRVGPPYLRNGSS